VPQPSSKESKPSPEKPTPPPMQSVIKGGWTYRVESPREQCVSALRELAEHIRTNSAFFVQNGPKILTPSETATQQQRIEALAEELDKLAVTVPQRSPSVTYQQLDEILRKLRDLGFYPNDLLVSNLARAFVKAGLVGGNLA
jgi:translation initiation factor 2B subunit (eIF-2B alpha/beta/delta family)